MLLVVGYETYETNPRGRIKPWGIWVARGDEMVTKLRSVLP